MSRIHLIGASVRAICMSAIRAGFEPVCFDLFADQDLQKIARVTKIAGLDDTTPILTHLQRETESTWSYAGGIENQLGVTDLLKRVANLWGNDSAAIKKARDPRIVHAQSQNGVNAPRLAFNKDRVPTDKTWLVKPLRGGGGKGIELWTGQALSAPADHYYWQKWISGDAFSALFIAIGGRSRLFGVTRQLVGEPWLNSPAFAYCGSMGPLWMGKQNTELLNTFGQLLTQNCNLRGVFGIDFIFNDLGIWPIELNPRYTASAEVLEIASGISVFGAHASEFRATPYSHELEKHFHETSSSGKLYGKAIIYALHRCTLDVGECHIPQLIDSPITKDTAETESLRIADVPQVWTVHDVGEPVVTVLAKGNSKSDLVYRLQDAARIVRSCLRRLSGKA